MENFVYIGELLAFLTAAAWALAVILFKKSGESVHPIALNLFKSLLAFGLIIPTMLILGGEIFRAVPARDYLLLFLSGAIGIGIADTLYFMGLNRVGAARTAIIGCVYSPFIIILSVIFLGESFTPIQMLGTALIISAIFITNTERVTGELTPRDRWAGMGYIVLANLFIAASIIIMKPIIGEAPLLWSTEMRLVLILPLLKKSRKILLSLRSPGSWKFTLLGSLIGTYIAMVLWVGGMKYTQASTAAVINQTSNIFVFAFAALFLGERITWQRGVAIVLAVGGAILVTLGRI